MKFNKNLYERMQEFLKEEKAQAQRTAHVNGKDQLHYTLNRLEEELEDYKEEKQREKEIMAKIEDVVS